MKLEISKNEIIEGDYDWEVHRLKDVVLLKYLQFANELGLQGKKIKEIVRVKPTFYEGLYIDFICEEPK